MEQNYQVLQQQLSALKQRVSEVSRELSITAEALQNMGVCPSESLVEKLTAYRQDFVNLRDEVLELATTSGVSPLQAKVVSLSELEQLLATVTRSHEQPTATESTRQPITNVDELKREIAKINWFHSIDLGNGVITPGVCKPNIGKKILPENLEGTTVLDIGAWDGFYSFEAERRGASRILATDSYSWSGEGWGTKAGFDLARKALNSKVEDKQIDVLDLSPDRVGMFDLVLFLGVLYHMRHPLLALERVASVTGKQLILETHVDMLTCRRPAMAFYPGVELNKDPTNWCGPNPLMVKAMLETVGFREVKVFNSPFTGRLFKKRMVFHAWR
jgi:tRNA (mo5U34)-methyltransferase